jgi:hypothetical protein
MKYNINQYASFVQKRHQLLGTRKTIACKALPLFYVKVIDLESDTYVGHV